MGKTVKNLALILVALSILTISISYAFSQYIEVKKHNLNVLSKMVQCSKDFEGEVSRDCSDAVKREYIPYYKSIK